MNASIEAAHAGTLGKGFSVIAQEIRKLSDETNKNAHNIEEELNQVIELVSTATVTAQDCIKYTNSSNESLKVTIAGIEEILIQIGKISTWVDDVLVSVNNIVQTSETSNMLVSQSVEKINSEDQAFHSISDFVNEIKERVQNMEAQINTVDEALVSVQKIAKENSDSVEKLTETLQKE